MRIILNCLLLTVCSLLCNSILFGEDEAKKKTTPNEENKSKTEEESEYTGTVVTYNKNGPGDPVYFLMIKKKFSARLPNSIGDKKIDFEQFNGKQVVVKGKHGGSIIESKDHHTVIFSSLSSIELKADKPNSEKNSDEKKKNDNLGNQPAN